MQLISAIVRTSKVDAICEALQSFGFHGLTVTEAIGLGKQRGPTEIYRGSRHSSPFQQASKIEIVTRDEDVDDLVDVICRVAATGASATARSGSRPSANSFEYEPAKPAKTRCNSFGDQRGS